MERPNFDSLPDEALVRLSLLLALGLLPFSASTLWRKVRSQDVPAPIKASANVTAWRVGDIRAWLKDPAHFTSSDNSKVSCVKRRQA